MKKFILIMFGVLFIVSNVFAAGEHNGEWKRVDSQLEECDFIGDAVLNINFKVLKIRATKWRYDDNYGFKDKLFIGKFRRNKTDIYMKARGLGYKHLLEGFIKDDRISLTFSSTHTDMNNKFGGCTYEFEK